MLAAASGPVPSKSRDGLPGPAFPPHRLDLAVEARCARTRLYPTTIVYVFGAFGLLLASGLDPHAAALWGLLGAAVFTWIEYHVHRDLLHRPFPDGPGPLRRFLHRRFDHLHYMHHLKPWDGRHMHGGLNDTLPFVAPMALVTLAVRGPSAALLSAVLLCYISEEWVHHAVHFYPAREPIFRWLKRRHALHHSPSGAERVFGLTSGVWDFAYGTRWPRTRSGALRGRGAS
jgi:hypothetical protein